MPPLTFSKTKFQDTLKKLISNQNIPMIQKPVAARTLLEKAWEDAEAAVEQASSYVRVETEGAKKIVLHLKDYLKNASKNRTLSDDGFAAAQQDRAKIKTALDDVNKTMQNLMDGIGEVRQSQIEWDGSGLDQSYVNGLNQRRVKFQQKNTETIATKRMLEKLDVLGNTLIKQLKGYFGKKGETESGQIDKILIKYDTFQKNTLVSGRQGLDCLAKSALVNSLSGGEDVIGALYLKKGTNFPTGLKPNSGMKADSKKDEKVLKTVYQQRLGGYEKHISLLEGDILFAETIATELKQLGAAESHKQEYEQIKKDRDALRSALKEAEQLIKKQEGWFKKIK